MSERNWYSLTRLHEWNCEILLPTQRPLSSYENGQKKQVVDLIHFLLLRWVIGVISLNFFSYKLGTSQLEIKKKTFNCQLEIISNWCD